MPIKVFHINVMYNILILVTVLTAQTAMRQTVGKYKF